MSDRLPPGAKFCLGQVVATPNALEATTPELVVECIRRHQAGDWGELGPGDRAANDRSLIDGSRLLSAYRSAAGVKFWIITEADRSATTVLLPEDY